MNRIEIPERGISVEYPSGWEELNESQFACVMQNWIKVQGGLLNQHEFLLIVLYNFLGIKRSPFDSWKDERLSKNQLEEKFANIWQLTETLHWLFRSEEIDGEENLILDFWESRNRFPTLLNDGGVELHGPDDGLLNITFGEYRFASMWLENFGRTREHRDLDRFIATIYRPERAGYERLSKQPDFDGNRREKFNPHLTEHYAGLLAAVPFWKKYTIFLWFFNCDRAIKEEEIQIGGKPVNFASVFVRQRKDDDQLDDNDLGLTSLLYMITESRIFGNMQKVDETEYLDVLIALLYWKQQADQIKMKK